MFKLRFLSIWLASLALLLPVGGFAQIQAKSLTGDGALLLSQAGILSKSQAIALAKRKVEGKVLSAELVKTGQGSAYKIKILTGDGRVKTVVIDADRG